MWDKAIPYSPFKFDLPVGKSKPKKDSIRISGSWPGDRNCSGVHMGTPLPVPAACAA